MTDFGNFFFELDNTAGFYFPGQTVTGRVVRMVSEQYEQIQYIQVEFKGMAEGHWKKKTPPSHGHSNLPEFEDHSNEEIYFDDTIQLNQKEDGTWITTLTRGRNEFPFTYALPAGIPASYIAKGLHADCQIFYQAQATFRAHGSDELMSLVNLPVERPIDLNLYPSAFKPKDLEGEKYRCCWCCRSGPISFKLLFNETGFLMRQCVEFLAEFVNHSSRTIKNIQVWISRTVSFKSTDNDTFYDMLKKELGDRLDLPPVLAEHKFVAPISLVIPKHTQINAFGCSFMKSIYEVNIEIVIPCGINMDRSIPIVIGTVPFVIKNERAVVVPSSLESV